MSFSGILKFLRGARAEADREAEIEKLAEAICRNLRGLGLYVTSKRYGASFWEIVASSSQKMITTPEGEQASGIALMLGGEYDPPTLVFEEINSLEAGLGAEMVGAVAAALNERPKLFRRLRVDDSSPRLKDGRSWWERVAAAHSQFEWEITRRGE
jgi:hypothetical protein